MMYLGLSFVMLLLCSIRPTDDHLHRPVLPAKQLQPQSENNYVSK